MKQARGKCIWTPENKIHVRCLFISKWKYTKSLYDLGLLTDDFKFFHCQIRTIYKDISTDLWLKLRRTFGPYQLSRTTDIQKTDNISDFEPIASYFKILQSQLHFNMRSVNPIKLIKRIESYHPTYVKHVTKCACLTDVPKLWKKILDNNKCPWINKEIDDWLLDAYQSCRERHQFLRLGLYYMVIKQYYYNKYKLSKSRQKNKISI